MYLQQAISFLCWVVRLWVVWYGKRALGLMVLCPLIPFVCWRVGTLVHVDVMQNFMLMDQFFNKLSDCGAVLHLMGEKDT